jgi:actin-related protein
LFFFYFFFSFSCGRALREKTTEILFETLSPPALFVSKSGVLSSFANGKSSGLVVELGGGVTCCTPVHDGYALQKCM